MLRILRWSTSVSAERIVMLIEHKHVVQDTVVVHTLDAFTPQVHRPSVKTDLDLKLGNVCIQIFSLPSKTKYLLNNMAIELPFPSCLYLWFTSLLHQLHFQELGHHVLRNQGVSGFHSHSTRTFLGSVSPKLDF